MTTITIDRAVVEQALETLELVTDLTNHDDEIYAAITALRAALAEPVQEPVAWTPIEQLYPQGEAIDILMGDGSILCAVLPQFDGDLWWEGSGTGEKFIDPKYANVTHWRIHGEHTTPPKPKPEPVQEPVAWMTHGNDLLPLFHRTRAGALAWGAEPQPLYASQPQHAKPLPQLAESQCPYPECHPSLRDAWLDGWEAAERAHGIGGQDE